MSPELPEKLLGIDIEDPSERRPTDASEDDEVELERFVFVAIGDQELAIHVDDVKTITDPPENATRVPRSPEAIEGVVDIRGEVTVVIEPRVHFPVPADPADRQRLVVFDRPTDEQPAGIRVDDVLGVETVPAENVLTAEDVDTTGGAFDHPLVRGIVEQKQRPMDGRTFGASGSDRSEESEGDDDATESPLTAARRRTASEEFDVPVRDVEEVVGEPIDEDEADRTGAESGTPEPAEPEPVTVDRTALIDVERLLLASGPLE